MAAIPDATLTIRDGGLGLVEANDNGVPAFIGACSSGTAGTVYTFTDAQTLKDTLGTGPLVEAACLALAIAGGPVVCVKATATGSAVGSSSKTGTGTATMATSGTALDKYDGRAVIVTGGATLVAGDATFKYSLDGGRTYSAELALPTSGVYVIPGTGVTLTWSYTSGTAFVAGDYWTFTSAEPTYTLSEAQTQLAALLADNTVTFFIVHFVGAAASVAAAATMYAAIETAMQAAANSNYRYARAIIEAPSDTDANTKTAFASTAGTRTMVGGRFAYTLSAVSGVAFLRNVAWLATAWAARLAPHEDLGKVKAGNVLAVHSLSGDEFKTPGLDAAGFVTMRTHVGKKGYFFTNGRIMATPGSDFRYLQYGRVMDIACTEIRAAQLEFLNDEVRVSKTTGKIIETDARNIEAYIEARVRAVVTEPGYASNVEITVDRDTNVLSTQKLVVRYRIVPLAYAKTIEGEVAYENPALRQVAAA